MNWRPCGTLFHARRIGDWSVTHAALPIVDSRDGSLCLYFTARDARGHGQIGRATVSLDPPRVLATGEHPVLTPGRLGAFDDSGVTGSCLVRDGDRLRLYYTGWNRGVTVPFYLAAGVAESTDGGRTFTRLSDAPLLERSAVDPLLTASPWVLRDGGRWRMWYISATAWDLIDGQPRHAYHIRYAESDDGLAWRREGRVAIDYATPREYAFGRPCVVADAGVYRMWYCVRGEVYHLGYAESADGLSWLRMDEAAGLAGDPEVAYPVVFDHAGRRWLLYNESDYGRSGIALAVAER